MRAACRLGLGLRVRVGVRGRGTFPFRLGLGLRVRGGVRGEGTGVRGWATFPSIELKWARWGRGRGKG